MCFHGEENQQKTLDLMRWPCKNCDFRASKRLDLLKHYRLNHFLIGPGRSVPCLFADCPCSFKSWRALRTHLSRDHNPPQASQDVVSFSCLVCRPSSQSFHTERQYFEHLGVHLKKFETVHCVFKDCAYSTNIYSTFVSHKSRKHNPHSLEDFKDTVIHTHTHPDQETDNSSLLLHESEGTVEEELINEGEDLVEVIVKQLASLFLKLDCIFNVPNRCVDEIVEELQFIVGSASTSVIENIVSKTFENHGCAVDEIVIADLVKSICQLNPISVALSKEGPLSTAHKRNAYLRKHFSIVEPIEYMLDGKHSFQYIPILQSLSQLLENSEIQQSVLKSPRHYSSSGQYTSFRDGSHFRHNTFLSGEELRLSLLLYCDDFEICCPLGSSRKKHKVTAVYWVFADIPSVLRSRLSSIYLTVLCKAGDVKAFGYNKILEPLLNDLRSFEENGIFVPCLGQIVKGTVFSLIADNLGAHSVGGFVESFSGSYVCRFCVGQRSQFQEQEVRAGAFPTRTREEYDLDIERALAESTHSRGVKRHCAITQKLSHFHVTTGYPPDVLHDLFEGIVPTELALCLNVLIKKKYLTYEELNGIIKNFPYKWKDLTNSPPGLPPNFASNRSIGGNATENWCLLRLLPLMIGAKIPEDEQAWQLLLSLSDVVSVVMSPSHTTESIGFLDSLIGEHRERFCSVFPEERLIPKHHFVEHYPELIEAFGPLAPLWTMRFEAKHSFFKNLVRQTNCFRNILKSMARKHQFMIAYHLNGSQRSAISVSKMSSLPLELVNENIQEFVSQTFPEETVIHFTKQAEFQGTSYSVGMVLVYGSTCGLPDFVEILQILVIRGHLLFAVKLQSAWYFEHFRCFKLEATRDIKVIEHSELTDIYPLAVYTIQGHRMVSLKHYICLSE